MKKAVLTLLLLCGVIGCKNNTDQLVKPYRVSGDGSKEFLYLSRSVAISVRHDRELNGQARDYYNLVRAAWEASPEFASETGDIVYEDLSLSPSKVGLSKDRSYLCAVTTYEPLGTEEKPLIMLCRLSDGTNVLGTDFKLLSQRLGQQLSFSNFALIDPAVFFKAERQKVDKR